MCSSDLCGEVRDSSSQQALEILQRSVVCQGSTCPQSWVSVGSGVSGHPMTALKEVLFLEAAFPRPPRAWTQKPSPCQGGGLRIYLKNSETHFKTSGKARLKVPEAQDHGFNHGTCLFCSLILNRIEVHVKHWDNWLWKKTPGERGLWGGSPRDGLRSLLEGDSGH